MLYPCSWVSLDAKNDDINLYEGDCKAIDKDRIPSSYISSKLLCAELTQRKHRWYSTKPQAFPALVWDAEHTCHG